MSETTVRVDVEGGIATVTIDRPKSLNALNTQTLEALCIQRGRFPHWNRLPCQERFVNAHIQGTPQNRIGWYPIAFRDE